MSNNVIIVNSASELLTKYMTADAVSNSNLFRDSFPTNNLYEGRIIFLKVHQPNNTTKEEEG